MLHINNITIKNFRPYYGIQTFDFGESDGLSIVLGDNGIGKSSLIRAIKFVLYNELDSLGPFKLKNEINVVAWEEQNYEMYVAVHFTYNSDKYVLKRIKRLKGSVHGQPKSDVDFEDTVTLIKNETFLSLSDTLNVLKNVIPKKISEYILFEGETITKYKDLLDNNKNLEIYESIRKILGITTLENSKFDLERQLEKYNLEKTKQFKEQSKNQKLLSDLDGYIEQQNEFKSKKQDAEKRLSETIEDKNNCEAILKNNQRVRDLMDKKSSHSSNLELINQGIKLKKDKLKELLKNYKSVCNEIIEHEINFLPSDINKIIQCKENNDEVEKEISILEGLLDSSKCKYCGHDIVVEEMSSVKEKIERLKIKIIDLSEEQLDRMRKFNLKVSTLRDILTRIQYVDFKTMINSIESEIETKLIEKDKYSRLIKETVEQIENLGGSANIEQVAKAYTIASKNEEIYKDTIKKCDEELKKLQNLIDDITRKSPAQIDLSVVENKIEKTNNLITIFEKSINEYSEKMRIKVQNDASTMFKNISENKEYDKLEFDERYGLRLIDKNNRIVPNISSGYMTLITISLIYGLHKNSSLTGTIILDAPFSVLTNFHRDKIIRTFQSLSPQVLLLVYKDQIDINIIRNTMQGKLINEYEIYQDRLQPNSSYMTKIREAK